MPLIMVVLHLTSSYERKLALEVVFELAQSLHMKTDGFSLFLPCEFANRSARGIGLLGYCTSAGIDSKERL